MSNAICARRRLACDWGGSAGRGATVRNFACASEGYAQAAHRHGLWVVQNQFALELRLVRLRGLSIEDDERGIRPAQPIRLLSTHGGGCKLQCLGILDLQGRGGVSAEYADTWARHDVRLVWQGKNKITPRTKLPSQGRVQRGGELADSIYQRPPVAS